MSSQLPPGFVVVSVRALCRLCPGMSWWSGHDLQPQAHLPQQLCRIRVGILQDLLCCTRNGAALFLAGAHLHAHVPAVSMLVSLLHDAAAHCTSLRWGRKAWQARQALLVKQLLWQVLL